MAWQPTPLTRSFSEPGRSLARVKREDEEEERDAQRPAGGGERVHRRGRRGVGREELGRVVVGAHRPRRWGTTPRLTTVSASEARARLGVVDGAVQPAALVPGGGAAHDELGDGGDVAQLEQVAGDEVLPVVLADLFLEEGDAAGGAAQAGVGADDADVVPHGAAELVPVVGDHDRLVAGDGVADLPGGHVGEGALPELVDLARRGAPRRGGRTPCPRGASWRRGGWRRGGRCRRTRRWPRGRGCVVRPCRSVLMPPHM